MVEEPRVEPFTAVATDRVVIIDGAGIALTLAPGAAALAGENLLAASAAAKQQRIALPAAGVMAATSGLTTDSSDA